MIGQQWLTIKDDIGKVRLQNEGDYVRVEIETALRRKEKIRVKPLLVDGTPMPLPEQLPDSIKPLAFRNAVLTTSTDFSSEATKLVGFLRRSPLEPSNGNPASNAPRWSMPAQSFYATEPQQQPYRQLRVYAYDPLLAAKLGRAEDNEALLEIRWETNLRPGPIGEYVEIIDVDPASRCCYPPVDLNAPSVLASLGFAPSETNPQFHQQMAYAVSMKTIAHFEKAMGRKALWAPREILDAGNMARTKYVQQLRIYPHALRAKNAYYSPEHKALLLGYFKTPASASGTGGGVVFTSASNDVVAHETAHALLDGVRGRFRDATNPDVFAFHEAFGDIVALFQHLTLPEAVRQQIAAAADPNQQNLLGQLVSQFGETTGRYGALRYFIGGARYQPARSDYDDMSKASDPRLAGSVLVAAVFDAFLKIFKRRTDDLLRLATGGTGVMLQGEISADLVNRLAREASKVAGQMLNICIRSIDYCPPIDIVFGEYLRALISADTDLVPRDRLGYRVALIKAFRDCGIYPRDVKQLSPGSLHWEPPPIPLQQADFRDALKRMSTDWDLCSGCRQAYDRSRRNANVLWHWLMDEDSIGDEQLATLGLIRIPQSQPDRIGEYDGELRPIEIHSVRPLRRVSPDRRIHSDLIIEITQSFRPTEMPGVRLRGGCTLIIDLASADVRYMVLKKVDPVGVCPQSGRSQGQLLRRSDKYTRTLRDDPSRAWIGEVL